jgi:hypothetical protein
VFEDGRAYGEGVDATFPVLGWVSGCQAGGLTRFMIAN